MQKKVRKGQRSKRTTSDKKEVITKAVPKGSLRGKIKSMVHSYRKGRMIIRPGKGFSIGELKEAGLTIDKAKALGISVDLRRKTIHNENVRNILSSANVSAVGS